MKSSFQNTTIQTGGVPSERFDAQLARVVCSHTDWTLTSKGGAP